MCTFDSHTQLAPLIFSASSIQHFSTFPHGTDQLWIANIEVLRKGAQVEFFEQVLFVESNETTFIYGIEFDNALPKTLAPDLALKQQRFIFYLRHMTKMDNDSMGLIYAAFAGHEYSSECKATAAYIAQRGLPLSMGIGYFTHSGNYELIRVDSLV